MKKLPHALTDPLFEDIARMGVVPKSGKSLDI